MTGQRHLGRIRKMREEKLTENGRLSPRRERQRNKQSDCINLPGLEKQVILRMKLVAEKLAKQKRGSGTAGGG